MVNPNNYILVCDIPNERSVGIGLFDPVFHVDRTMPFRSHFTIARYSNRNKIETDVRFTKTEADRMGFDYETTEISTVDLFYLIGYHDIGILDDLDQSCYDPIFRSYACQGYNDFKGELDIADAVWRAEREALVASLAGLNSP